jgi:hypothetical protein
MARKKVRPFESEFKIIIPRNQTALKKAVQKMSDRFGGTTVFPVRGAWWDKEDKRIIYDKNYLVISNRDLNPEGKTISPSIMKFDRQFMEGLARELGTDTKQKEMWIEEDIIRDVEFIIIPRQKLKEVI